MTLLEYVLATIAYGAGGILCFAINAYLNARFAVDPKTRWSSFYDLFFWPVQVLAVAAIVASYPIVAIGRKARELGERHRQESSR